MDLLHTVLYDPFTVLHVLLLIGGLLIAGAIWKKLAGNKTGAEQHLRQGECGACGWTGRVSTHNRKCPKCNAQIPVR